ncbi:WXG100-like domain-containing protein [Micromonospora sp. NPDC003197]
MRHALLRSGDLVSSTPCVSRRVDLSRSLRSVQVLLVIELWDFGDPWNVIRDAVIWLGSGGETWSESNEDEFRLLAAAWRAVGEQLGPAVEGARGSAGVLSELWGGDSGAWFAQVWQQVGGDLPEKLFEAVGVLADSLDAAALDVEHTKLSTLLEVGIVITEIFVFAVMAWLSFGAAMTLAAARIGVTRLTVRQIFELLVSRAGASFTQRSGYAGLREMASGLRVKTLALAAGDEAVREGVVNLLPQLYQVKVLGTRESVDKHAVWVDAAAGAMGSLGSPVGDFGRTLAGKIDNGVVRGFSNIGADAASEWAEELLGNLGGSLADDGTFALRPPGFEQVAAGMARNYISNGARVGERVGSFVRGVVGLETPRQQLERQVREAREAAAQHQRDAQLAAVQARAAADAAQVRAQEAAAARDAARLAAGERSPGQAPSTSTSPAQAPSTQPSDTQAPGVQPSDTQAPGTQAPATQVSGPRLSDTNAAGAAEAGSPVSSSVGRGLPGVSTVGVSGVAPGVGSQLSQAGQLIQGQQVDPVRVAEEAAERAQRSADTAAQQARVAEQAAQDAREAVERAVRAESPEEVREVVRAAAVARAEAVDARNIAAAHADIDTTPTTSPDATPSAIPTGRQQNPHAALDAAPEVARVVSGATARGGSARPDSARPENAVAAPAATPTAPADADGAQSTPDTPTGPDQSRRHSPESTRAETDPASLPGTPAVSYNDSRSLGIQGQPVVPARPAYRARPASELRLGSGIPAESVRSEHYDPPTPAQERALDDAIRRDDEGLPVIHPPLDNGWTLLTNGGGPFQTGRHNNPSEVARALASTWFGRPMIAGTNLGGTSTVRTTEAWIGSPYVAQPGGVAGLDQIHAAVRATGPGAFAFVVVRFPGLDTAHELVVVNDAGTVKWTDPVAGIAAASAPPYTDVESSQALLLDGSGVSASTLNRHGEDSGASQPGSLDSIPGVRTTDGGPTFDGTLTMRVNRVRSLLASTLNLSPARAEVTITRAVEAAAVGGGTRPVWADEDPAAVRRRAAAEVAESRPGRSDRQVRPRLRYAIELRSAGYADAVRRAIDDLVARGYQPVRLVNGWATGKTGGVVSQWRDPSTGREFHLRLDTPESRAAYEATRKWQDARRSGADPARLRNLSDQRQQALARVRPPDGIDGIRLPDVGPSSDFRPAAASRTTDQPAAEHREQSQPMVMAWNDEQYAQLPLVTGRQAFQAVRDFVMPTPSGVEFTGDPEMRRYAEALRPESGVLKIALHGLRDGEVVVGPYRMSAVSFARGLADLNQSGRISLGDRRINLVSCYSGAGDQPAAATLARILRREVTGVTERMWTFLDGTEVLASPDVHNGRMPTMPADGRERTFGPTGREITSAPTDASEAAVPPIPSVESGGGSRAGPLAAPGSGTRLRVSGDRWDSFRTPDGRLHLIGDRTGTFREPGTYRLHHELDQPGTYRSESDFSLRSVETGEQIPDPLTDRNRPTEHLAVEGPPETYEFEQAPDQVTRAVQLAAEARTVVAEFQETTLRPLMDTLGFSEPPAVAWMNLGQTLDQLRAEHADDPAMLAHVQELAGAAAEHARLVGLAESAAAVPHVAAMHLLSDPSGLTGADLSTGTTSQGPQPDGEFLVARFNPTEQVLVILDTRPVHQSRYLLQDGSLTERGTPQHVRDVLETSPHLHEQLRQNPDVLDELHRALARGDLQVEFRRVEVDFDVDGDRQVSITTRQTDLSGLDLDGLADRLPPPSAKPDPALGRRLYDSARRLADAFNGQQTSGIAQITVVSEHTVEIHPRHGRPFRIDIATTPHDESPAVFALGNDGVHRVVFAANHLDGLDAAALDRFLTRTIGHVQGEVRATTGSRFGRLLGMHGGRLNRHDALVNDPTPGHPLRPSHADLVALAELDALGRLYADADDTQRKALEAELQAFIETRALREGVPGADARAELARRHLAEPTARLLEDRRRWWHDSDPVVAGTQHRLAVASMIGMMNEPVSAWGRTMYRVTPENWSDIGRLSFTFEVQSGSVPRSGWAVEFRGGGRERHFVLVVDRDWFDSDGPGPGRDNAAEYELDRQIRNALGDLIRTQHARPGEVPYRRIDRLAANAPTLAAAGMSIVVATVLGMPGFVIRRTTVAAVELATNNRLSRYVTTRKLENKHDRALAQLPDRSGIAEGELQRRLDASYDRAGELAATVLGDRSAAERTKHPDPDPTPDNRMVPEPQARPIRSLVHNEIELISRRLRNELISRRSRNEQIEFLKKIRVLDDHQYKLVMQGDARDAVVHVEVAHTADPNKVEVEYTDWRIILKVSPEIEPGSLPTAVRDALTKVAERQHELTRHDAGIRAYLARRFRDERVTAGPVFGTGHLARSGSGTLQVAAALAKALVQMVVDRYNGLRGREIVDLLERHDLEHSGRLSAAQRRNVGGQIGELANTGSNLARAALDRLDGTPHIPTPTPPAVPGNHTRAVTAVQEAIQRLNDSHGNAFVLTSQTADQNGNISELVYRSEQSERGYGVEMRFRLDSVEDGRPVVPAADRIRRGKFTFTVNVDADPTRIADTLTHIGDNILFDRENRLPTRRWVREDLVPATAQGGAAVATGLLVGSVIYGLLAGVGAVGFMISRRVARLHQLYTNDLAFIRSLSETNKDNTTPQHLREQVEQQRQPVEELEARTRQIEEQLAADPRTADVVARLRALYGLLPIADADLLPDLDERVAAFTDLPGGAQITRVADAEHTFRLTFKGASNRPEELTFEIGTGPAQDGTPITAYRVDSDVTYVLRVDPRQTPEKITDVIRDWASQEIHRISQQPTGLPRAKGRWLAFARDSGSQALASSVSLLRAPEGELERVARRQVAYSNSALVTTSSRELSNISYDGNEAVSSQNRSELLKRHISTAAEEHLAVFRADTDALLTRTQSAFDRLQYLEQIAANLPPAERPASFQQSPRTLPGDPVAWGVDSSTSSHFPFDPSDLDPTPRPGETPQQATERVEWARVAKVFIDLGDNPPSFDVASNDAAHASHGAHTLDRHGPNVPLARDPHTRTIEGRIYGDPPWPRRQNYSSRWPDAISMNRAIKEYVEANWQTIREDLALEGRHTGVGPSGVNGEGYYNANSHGVGGSPLARRYVPTNIRVAMRLVPGSDPARAFIVTAFPES